MKDLSATATGRTTAPIEECYALLADFEAYPSWFPSGVRQAEVLERDQASGEPIKIRTTLHASHGPVQRDFKLHMQIMLRHPQQIELRRLANDAGDREEMVVTWRLRELDNTEVQCELRASLSLPRLMPVGGLAQSMADQFLQAALAKLSR